MLSPGKLAFERDALMRFVGALDAIFRLAGTRKVFDHFENATGHIPTDCRREENNLSNLGFVRHRFVAVLGG
jgi:hypothetical protein